jgi:hypothetical protein
MKTVKAVAVAATLGASALAIQVANAGPFGFGPFGVGYGPYPGPVAPMPPPYLWRYSLPPYAVVPPPVAPAPWAVPGTPPQAPSANQGQGQSQPVPVQPVQPEPSTTT